MSRYLEKSYLVKYNLSAEFFKSLGLEVYNVIPLRKVFILNTSSGDKVLKRLEYNEEKIEFIDWCTSSINRKLNKGVLFNKTPKGSCYWKWQNQNYVLMDLIKGREITFSNPIEIKKAIELLTQVHNYGGEIVRELILKKDEKIEKWLGKNLIDKYSEEIKDIYEILGWVNKFKYKGEIDNIFLSNAKEYIREMERAKELLINSKYSDLRNEFSNMVICHNDLAEHNFLINDEKVTLIDFDYASIDMRFIDIADILSKGIKDVCFDLEKAIDVIYEYDSLNPITKEEYELIYISLLYPKASYLLFKNYYHKLKSWDEEVFISRIKNKVGSDKYRREFLTELNKIYKIK